MPNHLPREKKIQVVNGLCNGMSLRATSRVFDVHRKTVARLLVRVGKRCDRLLGEHMQDLPLKHLEIDETYTFVRKKEHRLRYEELFDPKLGEQYLFFAIDQETKLIPAWALGKRDELTAGVFLLRLKRSLALDSYQPQISSDSWGGYPTMMWNAFQEQVDWVQLKKKYGRPEHEASRRYPHSKCIASVKKAVLGDPDLAAASTSLVERANLTVRTMQRRFVRLGLAFSKKWENLRAACALHFAYYDFCWQHRSLRGVTPAMAANVVPNLWSVEDLVGDC